MKKNLFLLLGFLLLLSGFKELNAQRRSKAPSTRFGIRAGFNISDLSSAKGLDIYNGLAFYNDQLEYVGFTDTDPWKPGFNAGITMQTEINDSWFIQPALLFTTKGYKLNSQDVEIDVTAAYLQIPVDILFKYEIKDRFHFVLQGEVFLGVGVYGFTDFHDRYGENEIPRKPHQQTAIPSAMNDYIGFDQTVHGIYWKDRNDTFETEGTYRFDTGIGAGFGFEFWNFQLMFNYQFSVIPLYNYGYDFSGRYEAKGMDHSSAFEYLGIDKMPSPHQHVINVSLSYYFNFLSNKIKW